MSADTDILVASKDHLTKIVIRRPPHNYVDVRLIGRIADALEMADEDPECRVAVLASEGKSYCAGADLAAIPRIDSAALYSQAMRLFRTRKPIIAAVHGAAVGAGVGLALVADIRITCPEARFSVNFNRLGIHPGFGLSLTLPNLIGAPKAAQLFYTGRRVGGEEAVAIGLADELVAQDSVLARAIELAQEISVSAPLAVQSTRKMLRGDFADRVTRMNEQELQIQRAQFVTEDFAEGVRAMAARRLPVFQGR